VWIWAAWRRRARYVCRRSRRFVAEDRAELRGGRRRHQQRGYCSEADRQTGSRHTVGFRRLDHKGLDFVPPYGKARL